MTKTSSDAQLAAFLREKGLIPADYRGEVEVSAKTSDKSEKVKIRV